MDNDRLEQISSEIFFEGAGDEVVFDWELQNTVEIGDNNIDNNQYQTSNNQDLENIINEIKSKLDIISQNFVNEADTPQIKYLKSLVITDLNSILLSCDEHVNNINSANNIQQNLNNINITGQQLSDPVILSIPLN